MFPSFVDLAKPRKPSQKQPPHEPDTEDIEATLLQVMWDEFETNVDDDSEAIDVDSALPPDVVLSKREMRDLDRLTQGVTSILNAYAEERFALDTSRGASRPESRAGYGSGGSPYDRDRWGRGGGSDWSRPASSLDKNRTWGSARPMWR